ncbi:hypothetical protein DXG01_014105 [Tephrocybe rancida]|nr:hypothetical protein DXG01_014105 [Tephrocybe rancida]
MHAVCVPVDVNAGDVARVDELSAEWWIGSRGDSAVYTAMEDCARDRPDSISKTFTILFDKQHVRGFQNAYVALRLPGYPWYGNILVIKTLPGGTVVDVELDDMGIVNDLVLKWV